MVVVWHQRLPMWHKAIELQPLRSDQLRASVFVGGRGIGPDGLVRRF